MSSQFHIIREFKLLPKYKLWLSFDDGVNGEVDLSSKAGKGVFKLWGDFNNFSKAKLSQDGRSLHWDNNVDLCANSLYLKVSNLDSKDLSELC